LSQRAESPEKQVLAVKTILEQAKLIADDFSNNK
jgi:hypothetical protein